MEWRGRRGSGNIEDRRRMGGARLGGIGGFAAIAILLLGWFLGVDLSPMVSQGDIMQQGGGEVTAADEEAAQFVSVTLADTEEVWRAVFREQLNEDYTPPVLVLFKGVTQTACGGATAATGPFYCPVDHKVYLDTDFFSTMARQLGAGGDFAAAYVVAHEVGHHVQNLVGILGQTTDLRQRMNEADSNALSVRVELQADCLAGVWAHHASGIASLDQQDIREALNAAAQIGDDTLMRNAGRVPMPESFTHGTSEQRQSWFERGYSSGNLSDCDTFANR